MAFQFSSSRRASTGRYALQAARTLSMVSDTPARSHPSKRGSSAARRLKSVVPKSMPPSFSRRSTAALSRPSWSNGSTSPVTMPPDACGIVSFHSGCSSSEPLMIAVVSPTPLMWVRGSGWAFAVPIDTAQITTAPRTARIARFMMSSRVLPERNHPSLQPAAAQDRPDRLDPAAAHAVKRFVQMNRSVRVADHELQVLAHARRLRAAFRARSSRARPTGAPVRVAPIPTGSGSAVSPLIAFLPASQTMRLGVGRLVTVVISVSA